MHLVSITDFGTTGGTHLSGQANFSDGKFYRFIMEQGKVKAMALPRPLSKHSRAYREDGPAEQWDFNFNYQKPVIYKKRAELIQLGHAPFLVKAIEAKEEYDRAQASKHREEERAYRHERARKENAAELFAVLDLIAAEFDSDPRATQCFDRQTVQRAKAVVALVRKQEKGEE